MTQAGCVFYNNFTCSPCALLLITTLALNIIFIRSYLSVVLSQYVFDVHAYQYISYALLFFIISMITKQSLLIEWPFVLWWSYVNITSNVWSFIINDYWLDISCFIQIFGYLVVRPYNAIIKWLTLYLLLSLLNYTTIYHCLLPLLHCYMSFLFCS